MSTAISFDTTNAPPFPIHRFTVQEYHQLGEMGVLTPEDHVELLEGWIVEKMNQRPAHGFVVGLLTQWLVHSLPVGWICRCQLPITTDRSEPEPDIAIIVGKHTDFRAGHPSGGDCALVIEVADTSVAKDRAKTSIYASGCVQEYWIVNLADGQLERFTMPSGSVYGEGSIVKANETIEIQVGNETLELVLSELFAE